MAKTQAEIRADRLLHEEQLRQARLEVTRISNLIAANQAICKHPNAVRDEKGMTCEDCGLSTLELYPKPLT